MVESIAMLMPNYKNCMKHTPCLNNRVQWMLNKLRDSLIPQKHVSRVFSLLCKCEQNLRPRVEDPWENIQAKHLINAILFIDNYVSHHIDNAQANILKEMMVFLRRRQVIPKPEDFSRLDVAQCEAAVSKLSAFRMLYILQKAIEGNLTILEPPLTEAQKELKRRENLRLTFDLDGFKSENLKHLIGCRGLNLLTFMKKHTCYVQLDPVPAEDGLKVQATIKKKTATMETLERIKPELITFSQNCQEELEAYEELREKRMQERKEEFIELLKKTEGMGPNVDWDYFWTTLSDVPEYQEIKQNMDSDDIKQWFEEIRDNWSQIIKTDAGNTEVKFVVGQEASSARQSPDIPPVSIKETTPIEATVLQSSFSITNQPPLAGSRTSQSSETSPSASGISPMAVCNTLCLVHDRRWTATFQYFLVQCYSLINLPKKYGYPFSKQICTCGQPAPAPYMYFKHASDMKDAFGQVKTALNCWPDEQRAIVQPLINHLEKYDQADTWHSLVKFVYYFTAMRQSKYDSLAPDAKLPGTGNQCSCHAHVGYQSSASADGESDTRGIDLSSSGSLSFESLISATPGPTTSSQASSATPGSVAGDTAIKRPLKQKKVTPEDREDDCYFHGERKFVFQCLTNYLSHNARLHAKHIIPFCKAVCCCNEDVEFKNYFLTEGDCEDRCKFLKQKIEEWREPSKTSVKIFIQLCDDYLTNKTISKGFIKLVYYFQMGFIGKVDEFCDTDRNRRRR